MRSRGGCNPLPNLENRITSLTVAAPASGKGFSALGNDLIAAKPGLIDNRFDLCGFRFRKPCPEPRVKAYSFKPLPRKGTETRCLKQSLVSIRYTFKPLPRKGTETPALDSLEKV